MEEIIGLLVILAAAIFKAVNKKLENSGKKPEEIFEPIPESHVQEIPVHEEVVREEPVFVPKPKPVVRKHAAPKQSAAGVVERQSASRKPILMEEEETGPKEKIDPKKLIVYSEIMKPKFNE